MATDHVYAVAFYGLAQVGDEEGAEADAWERLAAYHDQGPRADESGALARICEEFGVTTVGFGMRGEENGGLYGLAFARASFAVYADDRALALPAAPREADAKLVGACVALGLPPPGPHGIGWRVAVVFAP